MISLFLVLSPVEPAWFSVVSAMGVDVSIEFTCRRQDGQIINANELKSQLVLLPRSRPLVAAYDVDPNTGRVSVPGAALTDPNGYSLELYQRAVNPLDDKGPLLLVGMIAKGVLRLNGVAYSRSGPLGPLTVPVVVGPTGPEGPVGPEGPIGPMGLMGPMGPQGEVGPANELTIGTVTTGPAGSDASATITGTPPSQTISFVIPQGDDGIQGIPGPTGATGAPAINLLSGTVDPVAGTGAAGDFYCNTATGSLFGPKTGSTWPVIKLTTYWG